MVLYHMYVLLSILFIIIIIISNDGAGPWH